MRIGNPLPASLPLESSKAARIFKSFVSPTDGIDGLIPSHVLRSAHGFAIFTVAKAGFLMSVRAGTGVVVARLPDGRWSPPSAIGTGGMGFGGQVGAEVAEFILVLNSKSALTQFMSAGSITLGGNASVALGPIGRNAEGSGALNSKGKLAAMYSYSKTKGAFAGISVEGSAIFERQDCNFKAYGHGITATKILTGHIDTPLWAEELSDILAARAGSYTEYVEPHSPLESPRNTSSEDSGVGGEEKSFNYNQSQINQKDYFGRWTDGKVRPPTEPYSFGSSFTFGSTSSSAAQKSSGSRKSIFTVSSWRLPSRQNSAKTDVSSSVGRQGPAGPHWMDHLIRTESPPPLASEKWSTPPLSNARHPCRSQSALITPQLTEISEGHDHEDGDVDGEEHKKDRCGSIESLSSIGSDDDVHSLHDWQQDSQTQMDRELACAEQHHDGPKRDWYGVIEDHGLAGKGGQEEGMIDDLMSFDHIGPPSPVAYFPRGASESDTQGVGYRAGIDHHNKVETISQQRSSWGRVTGINWGTRGKKPLSAFSSSDKLHCFEGPAGPQAIPQAAKDRQHSADQEEEEEGDPSDDFLVGTRMPSVSSTNTHLTGYLGQVEALFDFPADDPGDLAFKKGDRIRILDKIDSQWWLGSIGLRKGILPVNRVSSLKH
ncbi:hypothetical protein VP01_255g10 [Puccinia sorghi]|uniref:SH3 domain-containing protein n=1 Tax=Puccinia sorghi TaxID=27349 RepID=A0A0L6V530_9BASI|nr:hypothetical protein VP01_255g10 [Puccinia sorghi]